MTTPDQKVIQISKHDINEIDRTEYHSEIRIAFPQIQVGTIIDLKYEVDSRDLVHLRKWYFQEDIPVADSELKVMLPEYFEYKYYFEGYGLGNLKALGKVDGEEYPMEIDFIGKNKFVIRNIPTMVKADFLSTRENFRCSLRFQLAQINYPDGHEETPHTMNYIDNSC